MSTLEKAVNLLYELPEQALETVYTFMQFVQVSQSNSDLSEKTAFGIAHKYANPSLIEKEEGAFGNAAVQKHDAD